MKREVFFAGILFVVMVVFLPVALLAQESVAEGLGWWNDRVFYQVFVRSFEDSDGDTNGDLQGLISRLDYLNDGDPATTTDLGVTGLWLMPVMQSPSYHGYDVIDYRQIETDYGTNDDFKQLIAAAHERGIAVIIDFEINHTSREHEWFVDAQTPGSQHDQWYRWSVSNPGFPGPWGQRVWHPLGGRFYYGVFWEGMPDLNLRNPAVTQELTDIARFWLAEMGVDGFRLDGVKHLIEEGSDQENTPASVAWTERFHTALDGINPDALVLGEIWSSSFEVAPYVPNGVDVAFEFDLARATLDTVEGATTSTVTPVQERALRLYPPGRYAAFLTNHDQNRIMNELGEDTGRARAAASLLLTNPGVPFIYYGEEIGMVGVKPDECIRTPMQWEATIRPVPFTFGKNCHTNAETNNVAAQIDDPDSLLSHYRKMIHLRNGHSALRGGSMLLLQSTASSVYAYLRRDASETLLVMVNLSDEPVSDYALSLGESDLSGSMSASVLFGEGDPVGLTFTATGGLDNYLPLEELAPYSTTVIQFAPA